ncbi:GNAT family N-acetyltransferase [Arenimonas donghaensis]|uniref:N-acetyltransferase domain-containing protein n=1 Tax=Arenimonas donghaensis DSM 18148 = HO3-R19 TaxID=1121014 RepID=A0A087MIC2_9GAMM|nr:GNAT family N-acetyltransferase [Arenimonas donghaensis]KFL36625.1 hypothetical protein N788_03170 [Arenimonas donghaensis DSM 18148 = HO3-R19]
MSPVNYEVRLLRSGDESTLERVEPDVFDNPVQPDLAARYLADPNNLLAVAIRDGEVVGMASGLMYLHPDKPLQLFVNEVGVAASCRGQGMGKRLVQALLEQARIRGCTEAWVATELANAPARALYAAMKGAEDADHAVIYTWRLAGLGS